MTRSAVVLSIALAISAIAVDARAFSDVGRFDLAADAAGGGGRWFTGAPADGFTCAVCHGEPDIPFAVEGLPDEGYRPGTSYILAFDLGESAGDVSMALEITDSAGTSVGTLEALPDADVRDEERCRPMDGMPPAGATDVWMTASGRPVAVTRACGARVGRLSWTAPADGAGTVQVHAAAVRGNASGTTAGDRVGVIAHTLPVEGAPPPETIVAGSCNASGAGSGLPLALAMLIPLLAWRRRRAALAVLAVSLCLFTSAPAHAVPGPATTAVLANANVPESVALAERYARERNVPDVQVCALPIDEVIDLDLDGFRTQVLAPLEACLDAAGIRDRIEAILVIRGVPLRVGIPVGATTRRVSLAAALGLWGSTLDGTPLLGEAPGATADCMGTPCYAARYANPFTRGLFEPGFEAVAGPITWRPVLVTMLHGRSYEDAEMLLDSALAAEAMGGADGEFLFMDGRDAARGALDFQYPDVIADLMDRGVTDVNRIAFDANLTGRTLSAFFTGTSTIGMTIEGNTFRPGALVDNLTSFGAVPENFEDASMERQVSIARWVAQGVAGVHGTTDEPLNSVFPSRGLIIEYVDGGTLAESYHRNLPNSYWHNLVLGDPMLAPYAVRPEVAISGVADGEFIDHAETIMVTATDAEGFGVDALRLYRNGLLVAEADGDVLEYCLSVDDGETTTLLAVAQKADDLSDRGLHRPKGWTTITLMGADGATECDFPMADSGPPPTDSAIPGADTGPPTMMPPSDDGCGCSAPGTGDLHPTPVFAALCLVALGWWRRSRGRGSP